ncbi:MAG: DUF4149 domain-containing protein [Aquificaceae bacterium]|nr:DUF4149 domain-containing protein [Aquificaceae bacterium]
MDRFLLFLNSAYLGLGSFFSFFLAPLLFRVLQREQAGSVVERVFPVYFSLGFGVSLLTLLLGFRLGKLLPLLALINFLLHAFHLFYILPTTHGFKSVDYDAFVRWHGISMGVNLISLLLTALICVLLLRR